MKMKNVALPKIRKLNNHSEFSYISKFGKKAVSDGVILQVAKNTILSEKKSSTDVIRLGYIITKKIGNAVRRNRIKRRLKAAVSNIFIDNAKTGYDYVFIGRKITVDYPFDNHRLKPY